MAESSDDELDALFASNLDDSLDALFAALDPAAAAPKRRGKDSKPRKLRKDKPALNNQTQPNEVDDESVPRNRDQIKYGNRSELQILQYSSRRKIKTLETALQETRAKYSDLLETQRIEHLESTQMSLSTSQKLAFSMNAPQLAGQLEELRKKVADVSVRDSSSSSSSGRKKQKLRTEKSVTELDITFQIVAAIEKVISNRMKMKSSASSTAIKSLTKATQVALAAVVLAGSEVFDNAKGVTVQTYYTAKEGDFKPSAFVQMLDWNNCCSMSVLQQIANLEKSKQGSRNTGLLAGKHQIQRTMWEMQFAFRQKIGGKMSDCKKYWSFNTSKCLQYWVEGNVASGQDLLLGWSSDGYATKGDEQGILCGMKLGHTVTVPREKGSEAERLVSAHSSRNNMMITAMGFFKDNKVNGNLVCQETMKYAQDLHNAGFWINTKTGVRHSVKCVICQDMKAIINQTSPEKVAGRKHQTIGGPFQLANCFSNWCCIDCGSNSLFLRPACMRCKHYKGICRCRHQDEDLRKTTTPEGLHIPPPGDYTLFRPLLFPTAAHTTFCNDILAANPKITAKPSAERYITQWRENYELTRKMHYGPNGIDQWWTLDRLMKNADVRFHTEPQKLAFKALVAAEIALVEKLGLCETVGVKRVSFDKQRLAWILPLNASAPLLAPHDVVTCWFLDCADESPISPQKIELHAWRQVMFKVLLQEIYQGRRHRQTLGPVIISDLSIVVLCSMHEVMRITEWMLECACNGCLTTFGQAQGSSRIATFVLESHAYFCGVADKASTWNIVVEGNKVIKPGLCYQRCLKLLPHWVALMETLYGVEGQPKTPQHLNMDNFGTEYFMFVSMVNHSTARYNDDEIDDIQAIGDSWMGVVSDLGLTDKMGNYAHCLGAGHITNQMRRLDGSIYPWSNQDVEAKVAVSKADDRHTQRGGNSGGGNKAGGQGKPFPKAQAFYNKNCRRWLTVANGYRLCDEGLAKEWIDALKKDGWVYDSKKVAALSDGEVINDNGIDDVIDFVQHF